MRLKKSPETERSSGICIGWSGRLKFLTKNGRANLALLDS